ncbi:MAG TPA: hypothetical protein VK623_04175 [Flavobacterium sp.]|nr:hypothetical protein [Flavobacterium sp.]
MKANKFLLFVLSVWSTAVFSQAGDEKLIYGKIVSDTLSTAGINVVNMSSEKSAVTNEIGRFSIMAKAGDLLVLASEKFEYKRQLIEEADLKKDLVIITMVPRAGEKITALDEVVVKNSWKADDLNLHHTDHRDYTPAERKLYTARSGPVDILVNWLSGRTSTLKKELLTEMNERLLAKVQTLYEDKFYIETLKIPEDYIPAFQYYMIGDADFVAALKAKNKTLMRFNVNRLAVEFYDLLKTEKK